MRFVHQSEHYSLLFGILRGKLFPQACEIVVCGPAIGADEFPVPAGVVVDVDYAVGAGVKAALHQSVVALEVGFVERAAELVVDKELPSDRQTEDVELVVLDEMSHLACTGSAGCVGC